MKFPNVGDYIYVQVHSYSKLHVYEWRLQVIRVIETENLIIARSPTNHTWTAGEGSSRHKTWRLASKYLPKLVEHELGDLSYEQKVQELLER